MKKQKEEEKSRQISLHKIENEKGMVIRKRWMKKQNKCTD